MAHSDRRHLLTATICLTRFACKHKCMSRGSYETFVAAGGFFQRGISGGERKRVSVGHELLINPSIILLDEPTSGLDSTTAMNLVSTLCQLAAGGRAVITTIHQPSSRLYQQLDKLLLLSDGHAMYYGVCFPPGPWDYWLCQLLRPAHNCIVWSPSGWLHFAVKESGHHLFRDIVSLTYSLVSLPNEAPLATPVTNFIVGPDQVRLGWRRSGSRRSASRCPTA